MGCDLLIAMLSVIGTTVRILIGTDVSVSDPCHRWPAQPAAFSLAPNYPNPFNPATTIRYQLQAQRHVVLSVYDVMGRQVTWIVDRVQTPGKSEVTWNGVDAAGRSVASWVYVYRLKAGTDPPGRCCCFAKAVMSHRTFLSEGRSCYGGSS